VMVIKRVVRREESGRTARRVILHRNAPESRA
jgi:hypothetical protein